MCTSRKKFFGTNSVKTDENACHVQRALSVPVGLALFDIIKQNGFLRTNQQIKNHWINFDQTLCWRSLHIFVKRSDT
jgi:hypothetical protein